MVKSIVAFIAASAAVVHEEPLSCWPLPVPHCPKGWTKAKEDKYQEKEAQRKQAVSHTLKNQTLIGLKTKLVATGNIMKKGLDKLQENTEITKEIKGPPTDCDKDSIEDDEDEDFLGYFDGVPSSSSKKNHDRLARAAPHFKDHIEGMESKFDVDAIISPGVDKPDDKKMHELLVIFTDANAALKTFNTALSTLPNTMSSFISRLRKDAKAINFFKKAADNTSIANSKFHEYACRIGMDESALDWATLQKTNEEMIQKYEAALKIVEEYRDELADAIDDTNTMMEKLISEKETKARFSLDLETPEKSNLPETKLI